MSIEIVVSARTDRAQLDAVRAILRAHNHELNPQFMRELETSEPKPLVVLALTGEGNVAGGLIAQTRGRGCSIQIVAVQKDLRRRGVGTALLEALESEATARGCRQLFLETLDYQAPEFYEARGYLRQCELADWDSYGHAKYIYVKVLEARQTP